MNTNFEQFMDELRSRDDTYEDGDYDWMRSCYEYCGDFSSIKNVVELQDVLAHGLINVVKHIRELKLKNAEDKIDELMVLLDIWIEHDENGEAKFFDLIPDNEDEEEKFFKGIETKLKNLDPSLTYSHSK